MTSTFLDIFISVPNNEERREIFISLLSEIGFQGFLEDEHGIHSYIPNEKWNNSVRVQAQEIFREFQFSDSKILSETIIENKNWNEEWEKTIQPIYVTEKIIIAPSWHPIHDKSKLVITIDPKMTFGTGYHETTRLVLRALEKQNLNGKKILDVGTGTGILAIAAAKLGAHIAIGVDTDELCRDNGNENISRNNVEGKVKIEIGSLDIVQENNFDLIFANIIRNTILELLEQMLAKLTPNGIIILSGLLFTDHEAIEKALIENHCEILEILRENEWISITSRKINEYRFH